MARKDEINDIERRLQETEDSLARLPITFPTSIGEESPTILLGQATTAVTSGTSTFSIDNIIVVEGTDPRPAPVSPSQTISVKNTFSLDIANNAWVFAIKSDADGLYETWRPGEGNEPPVITRFRLTADFTLSATSVAAEMLNDDGSVEGTAITLTDNNAEWFGYGPYTAVDDSSQPGFRGVAIKYIEAPSNERWYIVHMEAVAPEILVRLNENPQTSPTATVCIFQSIHGTPANVRLPKRAGATSSAVNVVDRDGLATRSLSGQTWVASWRPATAEYVFTHEPVALSVIRGVVNSGGADFTTSPITVELISVVFGRLPVNSSGASLSQVTVSNTDRRIIGKPGTEVYLVHDRNKGSNESDMWRVFEKRGPYVVMLDATIPKAVVSSATVNFGTGDAKLMERSGATYTQISPVITVPVINLSETDIRASVSEPIVMTGDVDGAGPSSETPDGLILHQNFDFRSLPGYAKGTAPGGSDDPDLQIPYHSGGVSDFKLDSEDCSA